MLFHLRLYHIVVLCWQLQQGFTARMPRSREILNKGKESRRWKIPAGPILRLHMPSSALSAGWPACMPTFSLRFTHTLIHRRTHTCSTRFTGDKPARVILAYFSAQSIYWNTDYTHHGRGGSGDSGGWMKNEQIFKVSSNKDRRMTDDRGIWTIDENEKLNY